MAYEACMAYMEHCDCLCKHSAVLPHRHIVQRGPHSIMIERARTLKLAGAGLSVGGTGEPSARSSVREAAGALPAAACGDANAACLLLVLMCCKAFHLVSRPSSRCQALATARCGVAVSNNRCHCLFSICGANAAAEWTLLLGWTCSRCRCSACGWAVDDLCACDGVCAVLSRLCQVQRTLVQCTLHAAAQLSLLVCRASAPAAAYRVAEESRGAIGASVSTRAQLDAARLMGCCTQAAGPSGIQE